MHCHSLLKLSEKCVVLSSTFQKAIKKTLASIALALFASFSHAEYARIAVASNFTAPMKAIEQAFYTSHPQYKLTFSYASSGKLYAQILHGAPYALFFSADREKPSRLIEEGLAEPSTRFTYAVGILALWAGGKPVGNDLSEILSANEPYRLAIANPKLAPFGEAAMQVLNGIEPSGEKPKIIKGENVSQAYQFVYSGNAPLGFVALSQIINSQEQTYWIVPQELHTPIVQDAVMTKSGQNNKAAQAFMQFIQSDKAKEIIVASGYREASQAMN